MEFDFAESVSGEKEAICDIIIFSSLRWRSGKIYEYSLVTTYYYISRTISLFDSFLYNLYTCISRCANSRENFKCR